MREKLIQYVELLFAGSTVHDEVRQEILQNTLDRFDDLVDQGKPPEAAYQLAISGIGDINEILGTMPPPCPPASESRDRENPHRKLITAISTALYILCPVPVLILEDVAGVCLLLGFVAAATLLRIWNSSDQGLSPEEAAMVKAKLEKERSRNDLSKSISRLVFAISLAVYFVISFATGAWYITWVIFPITAAVNGLIGAILDLKEANGHET